MLENGAGAEATGGTAPAPQSKHKHLRRNVIIGAVCAAVVVVGIVFAMFWTGTLAPTNAAAKYGEGFNYVTEDEVTDYISRYKTMMQMKDADDDTWGQFLAQNNLTPERLRISTIQQLVSDDLIQQIASKDGLSVSDEEVQNQVNGMKNTMAFGSDDIWSQTIQQAGTTEEAVENSYRQQLLTEKVYQKEVETPEPSDDDIKSYISGYVQSNGAQRVKHIYYFTIDGKDNGKTNKAIANAQEIRAGLVKAGVNKARFKACVQTYSNNENVKQTSGAYGWSIDMGSQSDNFQKAVESTKVGKVSEVFAEDNGYSFVWIDTSYKLPSAKKAQGLDLSKMPDTLRSYFKDSTAYSLWRQNCTTWLSEQITNADIKYYPMPSDVPYNVDMSKYTTDSSTSSGDSNASGAKSAQDSGSSPESSADDEK